MNKEKKEKEINEEKNVDKKYIWNLKDIYKNEEEYNKDIEKMKELANEIEKYEGKLKDKENVLKIFNLTEELSRIEEKVGAYSFLDSSINLDKNEPKKRLSNLEIIGDKINEKIIYITPELSKLEDEKLKDFLKDKDFEKYKYVLEEIIEDKKHVFSKEIEQIIDYANAGKGELIEVYNILTELEMPFEDAEDKDGKKYEITNSKYSSYLESKDETLRKTAMFSRLKGYKKFNNTLSTTYIGLLKSLSKAMKYRKYKGVLETKLKKEDLTKKVYDTLITGVKENIEIYNKYRKLNYELYKKMGLTKEGKRIKPWDASLKIFEEKREKIPYEKAKEMVLDALNILGEEYIKKLEEIFESRHIDVFPRKGKESGGYNLDIYDSKPYILLNYDETYEDVTTIAHELGHAMHGILSKVQPYVFSSYNIMLAETASTTNEIIMASYLIDKETNKKKKAQMLINLIDMIAVTLILQTSFGSFEERAFKLAENDEILTPEVLNNLYEEINEEFYPSIYTKEDKKNETDEEKEDFKKVKELKKYSWTRVPHFYRPFYVYKYSIGVTAAINIYLNIKKDKEKYLTKYFDMLKSGGSKKVIDTFKIAKIDLEDKKIYKNAFIFLDDKIEELKNLINEI